MSQSLLQFSGSITRAGVGLQFIETIPTQKIIGSDVSKGETWLMDTTKYPDKFLCHICGKLHPYIHVAYRKPAGSFGAWCVFRINGTEEVPDLSIPISVGKTEHIKQLPKDAVKLSGYDSAIQWHN
jgi:hypothetical protein